MVIFHDDASLPEGLPVSPEVLASSLVSGWAVRPWDEFKPYRLGGPLRNASEAPMSPLGLAPLYDAIGPALQAVSAHIHCAVLCALVRIS